MALESTKMGNRDAQMRKGVLDLCVLALLSEKELYPSELIEKLKDHQLIVVEGTLYPLLSRLKNEEMLAYCWVESNSGPPRKYYKLTGLGEDFLRKLKKSWQDLSTAVNHITRKI